MVFEGVLLVEGTVADGTHKRFLTAVNTQMALKLTELLEVLLALRTRMDLLIIILPHPIPMIILAHVQHVLDLNVFANVFLVFIRVTKLIVAMFALISIFVFINIPIVVINPLVVVLFQVSV